MSERPRARPPRAALALGLSGLLPIPALLAADVLLDHPDGPGFAVAAGTLYAALILSFLGGMWWSAACNRLDGGALARWLCVAVLPSLWAAASFPIGAVIAPLAGTALMLATGLLAALIADRRAVRADLVPAWWMGLRIPLSCGLAVEVMALPWLA